MSAATFVREEPAPRPADASAPAQVGAAPPRQVGEVPRAPAVAPAGPTTAELVEQTRTLGVEVEDVIGALPAALRSEKARRKAWGEPEHWAASAARAVNQAAQGRLAADRLAAELARAPASVRSGAGVEPAKLKAILDAAAAEIATIPLYAAEHRDSLERIGRIYDVLGDRAGDVEKQRDEIGAEFLKKSVNALQLKDFIRKLEGAVMPSNKEIQDLRKSNAADAEARVAQLVEADLVEVVAETQPDYYKSGFDTEADRFGASWGVRAKAAAGSAQWLREWEFHVHAEATRDDADTVTGFTILRGHIKPSKSERAVGASIVLPDAELRRVENSAKDGFLRYVKRKPELLAGPKKKTKGQPG